MSRHALSYLQLTGAITPERASRIVVVSTPEGQRTPLPTRSSEQPPHEKGRDIPPGIARMLQQIRMPQARPQPLQPRREPRPNARTSRTAVLPTGPPMGFNVTSTPSPRVLSRPGQFSPSPAWSPAVTSSWHSVRHVSPEHWSPACTPGGGSDRHADTRAHEPQNEPGTACRDACPAPLQIGSMCHFFWRRYLTLKSCTCSATHRATGMGSPAAGWAATCRAGLAALVGEGLARGLAALGVHARCTPSMQCTRAFENKTGCNTLHSVPAATGPCAQHTTIL